MRYFYEMWCKNIDLSNENQLINFHGFIKGTKIPSLDQLIDMFDNNIEWWDSLKDLVYYNKALTTKGDVDSHTNYSFVKDVIDDAGICLKKFTNK
jgi:hypothetical protein